MDSFRQPAYEGMIDCFNKVMGKRGGFVNFYVGFGPAVMRQSLGGMSCFVGFELSMKIIKGKVL